jgi:hypothetical protein
MRGQLSREPSNIDVHAVLATARIEVHGIPSTDVSRDDVRRAISSSGDILE